MVNEKVRLQREKGNKKKSDALGMPFGTANGRLRKSILFWLVQKVGMDICFRCEKKILSEPDLSIEHKITWEGVDTALFWDLNNIAFSHIRCNVRAAHLGRIRPYYFRSLATEGKTWCSGHQCYLPISNFDADASRFTGFNDYCKECKRKFNGRRERYDAPRDVTENEFGEMVRKSSYCASGNHKRCKGIAHRGWLINGRGICSCNCTCHQK